jgi:hypothetical protein
MVILHELVFQQAAFHTKISYNLCHRVAKILLQSYLESPSPVMVPCVDTFEDYQNISPLRSKYQCWVHPHWHLYLPSLQPLENFEEEHFEEEKNDADEKEVVEEEEDFEENERYFGGGDFG